METTKSSGSSRLDPPTEPSDDDTKPTLVRVTGAEPLSEEHLRELEALAQRPDSEIDYSDIPQWDGATFARAVRGQFYRPTKSQLTLRIDNDVLAWLKAKGPGYQTRINSILHRAMVEDIAAK
jgi:uncharacterized protein (DUF4415 family)